MDVDSDSSVGFTLLLFGLDGSEWSGFNLALDLDLDLDLELDLDLDLDL